MKKTVMILLLAGIGLAACNSNRNSESTQDTTDSMGIGSDMGTDTTGMDSMDNGTMNHSGDSLSTSTDSTLRQTH